MKKVTSLSIAAILATAIIAQSAPAKSIGLLCAGSTLVQKTTTAIQSPAPVQSVSLHSVIVHTEQCGCARCCLNHIKTAYPAPGYENVYNRYEARSTMGYKVLFDF